MPFMQEVRKLPANRTAVHLDVGANDGRFTASVMRRICNSTSAALRFVVFEPSKRHHEKLASLPRQYCPSSSFQSHQAAAWIADGQLAFYHRSDSRASSVSHNERAGGNVDKVASIDLARYLQQTLRYEDINYLKLDVEASEYRLCARRLLTSACLTLEARASSG